MNKLSIILACGINLRSQLEIYQRETQLWNEFLKNACVTAAYLMQLELSKYNIHSVIWHGKILGVRHTWLEAAGYIIDLTFTQFDPTEERVLIIAKDMPEAQWYLDKLDQGSIAPVAKQDQEEFFNEWRDVANPNFHLELIKKNKVA